MPCLEKVTPVVPVDLRFCQEYSLQVRSSDLHAIVVSFMSSDSAGSAGRSATAPSPPPECATVVPDPVWRMTVASPLSEKCLNCMGLSEPAHSLCIERSLTRVHASWSTLLR